MVKLNPEMESLY